MRRLGFILTIAFSVVSVGAIVQGQDDIILTFEIEDTMEPPGGTGASAVKCYMHQGISKTCAAFASEQGVDSVRTACSACVWNEDAVEYRCPTLRYDVTTIAGLEGKARAVTQTSVGWKFSGDYNSISCWSFTKCGGKCVASDPNLPPVLSDCPSITGEAKLREPKLAGSCQ